MAVAIAGVTQRARTGFVWVVLVAVGALVGYSWPSNSASPQSLAGTVIFVNPNAGGSGLPGAVATFRFKPKKGAVETFTIEYPLQWQGSPTGRWHHAGEPACLVPGSSRHVRVTLGVVHVSEVGGAPGGPFVTWIECYS
jgi:hypothetical protein